MAVTIHSLVYKTIADSREFSKGMVATRSELSASKKLWMESRTDVERFGLSVSALDKLHQKGAIDSETHRRSIEKLKNEMKDAAHAASSFKMPKMDSAGLGSLGKEVSGLGNSLTRSLPGVNGATAALAGLGPVGIAAGGALIGVGIAAMTIKKALDVVVPAVTEAMERIDGTRDAAIGIGISTEALGGFRHAAGLAGVSSGEFDTDLKRMLKTLGEAAAGEETAAEKFTQLGLNVRKLASQRPEQTFLEITDALGGIENKYERAAIAQDIFGKSGQALNSVLSDSKNAFRDGQREAELLGLAVNDIDSEAVGRANDELAKIGLIAKGAANALAVELAPAVESVAGEVVDFVKEWGGVKIAVSDTVEFAKRDLKLLGEAIDLLFPKLTLLGRAWDMAFGGDGERDRTRDLDEKIRKNQERPEIKDSMQPNGEPPPTKSEQKEIDRVESRLAQEREALSKGGMSDIGRQVTEDAIADLQAQLDNLKRPATSPAPEAQPHAESKREVAPMPEAVLPKDAPDLRAFTESDIDRAQNDPAALDKLIERVNAGAEVAPDLVAKLENAWKRQEAAPAVEAEAPRQLTDPSAQAAKELAAAKGQDIERARDDRRPGQTDADRIRREAETSKRRAGVDPAAIDRDKARSDLDKVRAAREATQGGIADGQRKARAEADRRREEMDLSMRQNAERVAAAKAGSRDRIAEGQRRAQDGEARDPLKELRDNLANQPDPTRDAAPRDITPRDPVLANRIEPPRVDLIDAPPKDIPDPEKLPETSAVAALDAAKKQIAENHREKERLAEPVIIPIEVAPPSGIKEVDAAMERLRERTDDVLGKTPIQIELDKLRKDGATPEQRAEAERRLTEKSAHKTFESDADAMKRRGEEEAREKERLDKEAAREKERTEQEAQREKDRNEKDLRDFTGKLALKDNPELKFKQDQDRLKKALDERIITEEEFTNLQSKLTEERDKERAEEQSRKRPTQTDNKAMNWGSAEAFAAINKAMQSSLGGNSGSKDIDKKTEANTKRGADEAAKQTALLNDIARKIQPAGAGSTFRPPTVRGR